MEIWIAVEYFWDYCGAHDHTPLIAKRTLEECKEWVKQYNASRREKESMSPLEEHDHDGSGVEYKKVEFDDGNGNNNNNNNNKMIEELEKKK